MSTENRPLIVGAGPVGLGAALFLARQGRATRLVEMLEQPAAQSRALAVNPRTLAILESTGVTRRMLELGLKVQGAQFHQAGRVVATLSFEGLDPKYPFMLALSQAATERLLAQALEAAGGAVERGIQMVECRNVSGGVEAVLERVSGGNREVVQCPWMLAADGAHSLARRQLGIDFAGTSFAQAWHLADAPLKTALSADYGHAFFLGKGAFLFMIRVIEGTAQDRAGDPLWRIVTNRPDPLAQLVEAEQAGPPVWASSFHIDHRINATLAAGAVYFAGDAAHVHSPLGARGMNLGLEDAFIFAWLERQGALAQYDALRRPVDRTVVRQVELLSRITSAQSWFSGFVRSYVLPGAVRIPWVRRRMIVTVTGLDHDLPPGST